MALTFTRQPGEQNYGAFRPVLLDLKKHANRSYDTNLQAYKITEGGGEEAETEKQQSEEQNYNTKLILNRVKHTHTDSEHNWLKNAGPQ